MRESPLTGRSAELPRPRSQRAPVNLVNLERAVKSHGQRLLLDEVSAGVAAGDRIGIVGRNGAGKSTLLSVLAGTEQLDGGRATRTRDVRIGVLPQRSELAGPVAAIVVGDLPEHAWAADPRTRSVLAALLPGIGMTAEARQLSGGEARRVALAAVLTREHDLLLLDEPTNHLDVEAIDWLARHLRERREAMVAVTHDRWFLDAVCTGTWELAGGRVHAYDGGYAAYVLARAERVRAADATEQRRRNVLRKELAWLRRGAPARTSKPRFRVEAANELIAGEPPPRDNVELARLATARLGKTVIDAEGVAVSAGPRTLLQDVTWQLGPGERVGLIGPNGSGKTTLLELLAGSGPEASAPALDGGTGMAVAARITRGKTVRIGYLKQSDAGLDPALTPREAVAEVSGTLSSAQGEAAISQLLDRLGLRGDTQWTPAGDLSGGERRRLMLLRILSGEPNVLFLDEPTNDLDVDTLIELEDLLDGWPGSLVLVSHDRYFLERVTDHVLALLGDGRLSYLPGGVDEYLDRRSAQQPGAPAPRQSPAGPAAQRNAAAPRQAAADAGGTPPAGAAAQRAARKEMQRLERQIDRLSSREAELTEALAAHAADYAALIERGAELRAVQEEKGQLEEQWLEAAEVSSG